MSVSTGIHSRTDGKSKGGFFQAVLTIATAILIGVLSTPNMYAFDEVPAYRLPIFACMAGLIFVLSLGRIGKFSMQKLLILFLWAGFATMELIAGMIHNEDLLALIWLYLGVPYLILCVFPETAGRNGNIMVQLAIVLAFAPYIIVSLVLHPLSSPYPGVFNNPNSFGMAVATMSAGLLALLRGAISSAKTNTFHRVWTGLLCLAVCAAFPLILMSSSRTSLITFAVLMAIFSWSLFFDRYKNRRWIILTAVVILGSFSLLLLSGLSDDARYNYFGRIVEKMTTKAEAGDVSAGRFDIWQNALNDTSLLGRGNVNFVRYYGAPPHNTYISVLGSSGAIATVFLIAIHGLAVFIAYRRTVQNIRQDGYAIGPLLVIVNFLLLGLAELVFGILGNGINMSFLLMLGILVNNHWPEEKLWNSSNAQVTTMRSLVEGDPQ